MIHNKARDYAVDNPVLSGWIFVFVSLFGFLISFTTGVGNSIAYLSGMLAGFGFTMIRIAKHSEGGR